MFKCNAIGSPKPQITWFHNGQKVARSNVGRIQINSKNELRFTSLQSGDKGTVQCVATNDAGEAISKATLNVKSKYQICVVAQYFRSPGENCKYSRPPPNSQLFIQWPTLCNSHFFGPGGQSIPHLLLF